MLTTSATLAPAFSASMVGAVYVHVLRTLPSHQCGQTNKSVECNWFSFRVLFIALLTCFSRIKCDRKTWNYSKVGCLPTLNGGTAPVVIQCCVDAWHCTNADSLLTLYRSIAPVFNQCCPCAVPMLNTVLIDSTLITLELQPERYLAGRKDCQNGRLQLYLWSI